MAAESEQPSEAPDPEQQVAWIRTPYQAPVYDQSGGEFGITDSLLGDEAADIFHGLAVKLHNERRVAEIAAALIDTITLGGVHTSIPPEQVIDLPTYQEERWFHLGQGGLFRKRPEWKDG
ncbi:MAG: hypothetical protein WAO09_03800 [Candidatus Dormiibacterota bacterium]|jgi:hypothetical protein